MSTDSELNPDVIFENEMFIIKTGLSDRFAGPKDKDGSVTQYPCYKLVNKGTEIVEKEGFLLVELVELALYSIQSINRAIEGPKAEPIDIKEPNNILTLQ